MLHDGHVYIFGHHSQVFLMVQEKKSHLLFFLREAAYLEKKLFEQQESFDK